MDTLPSNHFLFTSESVTLGHPDKLSDYISDSVLDACLEKDPESKVACETACKNSTVMVFGEISSAYPNIVYEHVVRQAIKEAGYDSIDKGLDYKNVFVMVALDQQSIEIADAVHKNKNYEDVTAGDQGLMIGYASDETKEMMPLTHLLCNRLVERLMECRQGGICDWMRPDAKVQVTVEYKQEGTQITPLRVHTVLISQQHIPSISYEKIQHDILTQVIKVVIPAKYLDDKTIFHINPSRSFIVGGPCGDAGLTGRKIIVDTYGGWGGHGGGAFSGKDPTKVDRSAAYAVRWVAKSLVSNGFCKRALVQVSYGIGIAKPLSIYVNTYDTAIQGYNDFDLKDIVVKAFDLRPGIIIRDLQLKRPIYKKTAHGGHFGRDDPDFTWEIPKDLSQYKKQQ
ncbi:S-adenosylmethionine synthetase, putative [Ichthyophthirius multifiliis]|uniref:S-adenosylmethionine synthase n=1 Tax=Ichthyophthirius multifiliis TaxID=5932 RepID=G0R4V5_ICHMU|nr:S-adenosylmethionine synthetase, putative [Ichthyophthirius multifiliis]EGR27498.1 S-adenosylmethionine synthetase, putative [Ichthyophthirius multifiliis]|eukprot:XP_004024408.1 S-adenosylmethionine synthetase, putative [Ichthyophthirius multifiliis]